MSDAVTLKLVETIDNISFRNKLFIIILFGFLIRLYVVVNAVTIANDSVTFLQMSERFSAGDYAGIFSVIRPPLYPLLTSLTSTIFGDIELSARVVSLVFGTLVIPVACGIGKLIYNEKVGLVAGLFAAIHPYMVRFSGEALTEGLYYFLIGCVLYFGLKAIFEKKPSLMLVASVFTAFAYLTKPGAIGYLIVISLVSIFYNFKEIKTEWKEKLLFLLFAWVIFLVIGLPYFYYLYGKTGGLAITGKFVATVFSSKSTITLGNNFTDLLSHFPESFSWGFMPLLIYGMIKRFKAGFTAREYSVFAVLLAWWVVFYLSTPSRKYMVQLMPIAIIFPALGYIYLVDYLKVVLPRRGLVVAIWLLLVICAVQMNQGMVALHGHRHLERQAGLWMKDNLGEGVLVTSHKNIFAYYAKAEHVRMREMDLAEKVAVFALKDGAEYLVGYPDKLVDRISDFDIEQEKFLKEVKSFESDSARRFVIYKIIPSALLE